VIDTHVEAYSYLESAGELFTAVGDDSLVKMANFAFVQRQNDEFSVRTEVLWYLMWTSMVERR
jgi:hypothetical protein